MSKLAVGVKVEPRGLSPTDGFSVTYHDDGSEKRTSAYLKNPHGYIVLSADKADVTIQFRLLQTELMIANKAYHLGLPKGALTIVSPDGDKTPAMFGEPGLSGGDANNMYDTVNITDYNDDTLEYKYSLAMQLVAKGAPTTVINILDDPKIKNGGETNRWADFLPEIGVATVALLVGALLGWTIRPKSWPS